MANTVLTRTPSSASNQKTFTYSVWVKRENRGSPSNIFCVGANPSSSMFMLRFDPDTFNIYGHGSNPNITTHRKFTDPTAWYHVVLAVDTTQATASDRVKLYVNGVQETSFSTATYPGQNDDLLVNTTTQINIGERPDDNVHFEGQMSHFHFIDGTAYPASTFGETDSTTGEWKIKTSPSVTYGTNGFFILKDGNSVTDQSPNTNNFTVSQGTLTKTEDCPSNNFCTMGTYARFNGTVSNGGNTLTTTQSNYRYQAGTIGVDRGKWYWEVKLSTLANYALMGITDTISTPTTSNYILGSGSYDYSVYYGDGSTGGGNGHMYNGAGAGPGNTPGQFMAGFSQGDIVTFALDLDSATKKLYVGANGQWANGSNATNQTFSNSTGKSIVVPQNTNSGFYFPAGGDYSGNSDSTLQFNFGNGYFGTTAVASAGTNASNNGIFEYDVPSGYTAICTKGLNS